MHGVFRHERISGSADRHRVLRHDRGIQAVDVEVIHFRAIIYELFEHFASAAVQSVVRIQGRAVGRLDAVSLGVAVTTCSATLKSVFLYLCRIATLQIINGDDFFKPAKLYQIPIRLASLRRICAALCFPLPRHVKLIVVKQIGHA